MHTRLRYRRDGQTDGFSALYIVDILGSPRRLSFHFEQVWFQSMHTRLRYRRDGQTDGFSALYIVDIYSRSRLASVPALSCRCMHNLTYLLLHLLSLLSLLYLPSFCLAIVFNTYLVYLPMAIATYSLLSLLCLPLCIMPTCYWCGCLSSSLVCYAYT